MDLAKIRERLDAGGNLRPAEFQAIANIGNTKFYADAKAGLIRVRKRGRTNTITAQDTIDYMNGHPMRPDPDAPAYVPSPNNPHGKNGKRKAA